MNNNWRWSMCNETYVGIIGEDFAFDGTQRWEFFRIEFFNQIRSLLSDGVPFQMLKLCRNFFLCFPFTLSWCLHLLLDLQIDIHAFPILLYMFRINYLDFLNRFRYTLVQETRSGRFDHRRNIGFPICVGDVFQWTRW